MATAIIEVLKGLFLKLHALWTSLPEKRKKEIRDKIWSIMQSHFERKYEQHTAKKAKQGKDDKEAAA